MNYQDKTREQLINDLQQSALEISALRKLADDYKKITDELNQKRKLYADLANALPAGIYRLRVYHDVSLSNEKWSSSNEPPYNVEFANDRFFEILKINRIDFEKNPAIINNLILEADKAEFLRLNVEANLLKVPFIWEGRLMINGNIIWIHFESIPRVLENGDIFWTGTLNDISKRKKEELEVLSKTQELRKLNAEKDKFFSIIAHDLKSPFNSITGFCELLTTQVANKNYENVCQYSEIILKSSERAMDLLSNLIEWSQSQTGRIKFNPEYFEIVAFIEKNTLMYSDIAGQKSIAIKYNLPHNLTVFADRNMINTVFRNLITNAIKFTMPGGEVNISAEEKQNEIVFSVSDTGVGIPQDSIDQLFQIDQCYSMAGPNNEKGTGLGLILCKEFIEKHDGKIWVESSVGVGTIFNFSLPVSPVNVRSSDVSKE